MAAHIVLLFLLLGEGEGNAISVATGLSGEAQDSPEMSSKKQVLPHAESRSNFFMSVRELGSGLQKEKEDKGTLRRNDGEPEDFEFKNVGKQTVVLKHPEPAAKSPIAKHSPEPKLNHERRSNLTNGRVQGVINDHSLALSSDEEHALQPELHLETGVGDVLPERTRSPEDGRSGPRSRCRRSWLWNQFFVIEEYRGPEPVLIGRVSCSRNQSAPACNRMELYLCLILMQRFESTKKKCYRINNLSKDKIKSILNS